MMTRLAALCLAGVLAAAGPAHAETDAAPVSGISPFDTNTAVDAVDLGAITGRADVTMEVRAQNSSTVSNNMVSGNSVTGTIDFDSQAFQNLNGLALVSANTGNNVSINASLNVNVSLVP